MATQRRQAAHDSGEDIWNRVVDAGEDGLERKDAIGRNTSSQFERGKSWIRDHQCGNKKTNFTLVHGRYAATNDVDKAKLYAASRLESLHKAAVRVYKCSLANLPPEAQSDLSIMLLTKTCKDIFAAMQFLEEAGFSSQAAADIAKAKSKASTASARGRKASGAGRH
ncbi:hypothetical protein GCM10010425_74450 [Streptomyces spororaveus]|uniref:Uncharacterized protein n=1 Tax=Streptomyces spororaveus TaxID=284039 RepID=A0ABQ3T267_9ACTN|nr:hypothetical protein [Streptomyces spororaveus]GHI74471.1 hypothetical protein Sspor_00320 [Streptomyces spororaveus]